jgi:hypothetical protein
VTKLPPWTDDDDTMFKWLVDQLFLQGMAEFEAWESLGTRERLKIALQAAWRGYIEPLRDLYPDLAPFLHLPKLGPGQKFPKATRVQLAVADVPRIQQLWRTHYGKRNRRKDETSAAEFAARLWDVSEDDIIRRVTKPSGKKKPRAK